MTFSTQHLLIALYCFWPVSHAKPITIGLWMYRTACEADTFLKFHDSVLTEQPGLRTLQEDMAAFLLLHFLTENWVFSPCLTTPYCTYSWWRCKDVCVFCHMDNKITLCSWSSCLMSLICRLHSKAANQYKTRQILNEKQLWFRCCAFLAFNSIFDQSWYFFHNHSHASI